MNFDFKDLLRIFAEEGVEYLVVGAYLVIQRAISRTGYATRFFKVGRE